MCACVRTIASTESGSTGGSSQFLNRKSLGPWNKPQSTRTRRSFVSRRHFEPVTVCVAPRKVSFIAVDEFHHNREGGDCYFDAKKIYSPVCSRVALAAARRF